MAAIGYPDNVRSWTVPSGTSYTYAYFPKTDPNKGTILFLHGFPSTSWDWRRQIPHFVRLGYGILAPDLIGYGGTDKPEKLEPYVFVSQAADIDALLAHGKVPPYFLSRSSRYSPARVGLHQLTVGIREDR